jgi:hypothetical protein
MQVRGGFVAVNVSAQDVVGSEPVGQPSGGSGEESAFVGALPRRETHHKLKSPDGILSQFADTSASHSSACAVGHIVRL